MRRLTTAMKTLVATGALLAIAVAASAGQSVRARKAKAPVNDSNTTVIYRCSDAGGMLSIQSTPCPRGQHQERSVIARPVDPAPLPSPLATATTAVDPVANPVPTPSAAQSPPVDDTPLPPPPLYRCHTPSGGSYANETDSPPERCREVPLVNISRSQNVPDHDSGIECQMEHDRCERIPDQELCATWKQRLAEARSMLELGNPDLVERATRQRDQAQQVITRSCLTQN